MRNCKPVPQDQVMDSLSQYVSDLYSGAYDYCLLYEKSDCVWAKSMVKIRKCLKNYPEYKEKAVSKDLYLELKPESPVKLVPTEIIKDVEGERPMQITIDVAFEIEDISDISDADTSFRLDYTIHMSWGVDSGNCFEHIQKLCAKEMNFAEKSLKLRPQYFSLIWLPDIFILNAASDSARSKVVDKRYARIRKAEGTSCSVFYTVKSSATMSCNMNFGRFPHDVQFCPIQIRSFRYPTSQLKLQWADHDAVTSNEIILGEHRFEYSINTTTLTILGGKSAQLWLINSNSLHPQIPSVSWS